MKSLAKRLRALRRLAVAGCVVALAAPAGASAMLPNDYGGSDSAQPSQQYTPPSGFRTEVQTPASPSAATPVVLRRSFSPEVAAQAPANLANPAPAIIRQIETVNGSDGGQTLAIVLAAIALAVALSGIAFQAVRMVQAHNRGLSS